MLFHCCFMLFHYCFIAVSCCFIAVSLLFHAVSLLFLCYFMLFHCCFTVFHRSFSWCFKVFHCPVSSCFMTMKQVQWERAFTCSFLRFRRRGAIFVDFFVYCLSCKNRLGHNIFNTNTMNLMRMHIVADRNGECRVSVHIKCLNGLQTPDSQKGLIQ